MPCLCVCACVCVCGCVSPFCACVCGCVSLFCAFICAGVCACVRSDEKDIEQSVVVCLFINLVGFHYALGPVYIFCQPCCFCIVHFGLMQDVSTL